MDLAQGNRAKNGFELNSIGRGLNSDPLLIIKLPDSRVLQIISRSFFLAIILLVLPSIGPLISGSSNASYESDLGTFEMLPVIFPHLFDEGLVRRGHKGIIVVGSTMGDVKKDLELLREDGIVLVVESNLDVLPNEAFDFVFGLNLKSSIKSVDRVLKANGIVITQIDNEPLVLLHQHPNYRIVYLRQFQKTMVAMRKTSSEDNNSLASATQKSKSCGMTKEARKVALRGLEDALLEPPKALRLALVKSMNGYKDINFLPDLVGDSLAAYRRRIFISDEKNGGIEEWFYKNYPTKNQAFEMYYTPTIGISDWLRSNVEEEDFIVMKAEAQVVEEIMKDGTICLVDELFLKCKNQWEDEAEEHRSKRAYWQCLALYGDLIDKGIAVHQWWS